MKNEKSNFRLLYSAVISNSKSKEWSQAKKEWKLTTIYDKENYCVCGQPIIENCVIYNTLTNKELIIGNVCINRFDEKQLSISKSCRNSLKKLIESPQHETMNKNLLELASQLSILSQSERTWYEKYCFGKYSDNRFNEEHQYFNKEMLDKKEKFNRLVLYGFSKDRPFCCCNQLCKPRQNGDTLKYFYGCFYYPKGCRYTKNI